MRGSINRAWNGAVRRRREAGNKGSLRSSLIGNHGTDGTTSTDFGRVTFVIATLDPGRRARRAYATLPAHFFPGFGLDPEIFSQPVNRTQLCHRSVLRTMAG